MPLSGLKISRFKSPDFIVVQWLAFFKALVETGWLILRHPSKESFRIGSLILRVKPTYTMLSATRLANLYRRVKDVNVSALPGDIVECGVWHGGSGALMGAACMDHKMIRTVWLFDSFQGLPHPGEHDGQKERDFYFEGWCKGDPNKVQDIFLSLRVPLESLKIVPGWFDTTLPSANVNQIAVLHIDADWYDSVKLVLNTLYDRVVPGGFIVVDDYWVWEGCKKAVDDFLREKRLGGIQLHNVGKLAVYFQKTV